MHNPQMNEDLTSSPAGVVRRLVDACACCDSAVASRLGLSCDAVSEHMKRKRQGEKIDVAAEYGPAVDLWNGAANAGNVAAAFSTLFPCEVQVRRLLA